MPITENPQNTMKAFHARRSFHRGYARSLLPPLARRQILGRFGPALVPSRVGAIFRLVALLAALAAPSTFALNPAEKPANYIVTRWDTEDGLPHNAIRQIFQTRDGYLWVGTLQGLARFDGLTFTVFTQHNTPSFPNNQITSFAETRDGSLWIGTSFGLARYRNGRFTSYGQADGLKADTINTVCVAPDGSLWIGGRGGITRWVDGKFVNDIDTSAYDTLALRVITVDRQKAMWVACGSEALRYRDGKFTHFGRAEGLSTQRVEIIREDAAGRILAVTQNGVFRLDGEHFVPLEQNQSFSSLRVGTALADRAGNFWLGSVGGLDRCFDGKVVPYTDRNGNKLGVVDAVFEDREGCLWVGTSAGLFRLTDRRGYSLSTEDGVGGTLVSAVRQARDGAIWVASWGGGVDRFLNGAVQHYTLGAPLSHETVTAIYQAPNGIMWLGTRGSSLDRLEGNQATTFVYQSGVATSRPVTAIYADPEGEFLLGISKRGLLALRGGAIGPVPEAAALANETVWTIARLRDGRWWIGTSVGLYERRADRSWQLVKLPGVPPTFVARALLEEDDGTIWIATDGLGLVRWAKGEARAYNSRVGMVDDTLFSVLDDNLGSLWVSSARGLARIRQSEIAEVDRGAIASLNSLTFGRVDGLLSASTNGNGSPAAVRLTDGRIMTATDNGVAVVDPHNLQVNSQPPTVVIETVVADDQPLALLPGQPVAIPRGTNRLEIRYTALSLIAPHQLRFRYQLAGSDPDWIEAGRDRSARYTHLAPGAYVFRVLACNNDGIWDKTGASVAFVQAAYFYQTKWFWSAVALGVAMSALGWYRVRTANLHRRNAQLERRIAERTAELAKSYETIRSSEYFYHSLVESLPQIIARKDAEGRFTYANSAFAELVGRPLAEIAGRTDFDFYPSDEANKFRADDLRVMETHQTLEYENIIEKDGLGRRFLHVKKVPLHDEQGHPLGVQILFWDMTVFREIEEKLKHAQRELIETSRLAGIAEMATGVLHNLGNALNSVNTTVNLTADRVQKSKVTALGKVVQLLEEQHGRLAEFFSADQRGQQLPGYLAQLSEHLLAERSDLLHELEALQQNVDHIKEIVAAQQSFAHVSGITETVEAAELVEVGLRISEASLARHGVAMVREFMPAPPVKVERQKVLQILVNLIRNAKEAINESGRPDKRVALGVRVSAEGRVQIYVTDNGVGIAPENLTNIFAFGFTTKKGGHGFGLHSSANAAKEMGGSLEARSDGVGKGATFVLELPSAS
jgi:PAS domain S-box-containing protein